MYKVRKHIFKILLLIFAAFIITGCCIKPESVDYSDITNWAYFATGENKDADLFLLCPTVYLGDEHCFNMSLKDEETKQTFVGALNMQKGIYENNTKMYAPFYQQAALSVYEMDNSKSRRYFDIAYRDTRKAFLYYMQHQNNNRPLILAGFSQGADMALRLLKEFFSEEAYQQRLVAAYIIGWRVTEEDLMQNPQLQMAQKEDDTGVIISFNSEAEFVEQSIIVPRSTVGINPLNWKTDSTPAPASMNRGACFTDYSGNILNEFAEFTGAYLHPERGTLKVPDVDPEDYPPILEIFEYGVFHVYDYLFFYRNLQHNVGVRIERFLQDHYPLDQ